MKIYAVLPAAGVGKRFGSDTPKQYQVLLDRTILEHSISRLQECEKIHELWIALHPEDQYWKLLDEDVRRSVKQVSGGAERADSVRQAMLAIPDAQPDDWVLVHDAVRPLVDSALIEQMLASLDEDEPGAIMAMPIYETVKKAGEIESVSCESTDGEWVSETLDRHNLWTAQTPQVFRFQLLKEALEATQGDSQITDEASAMEACGHRVRLFEGHRNNIKITRPQDLVFAEQLLKAGIGI